MFREESASIYLKMSGTITAVPVLKLLCDVSKTCWDPLKRPPKICLEFKSRVLTGLKSCVKQKPEKEHSGGCQREEEGHNTGRNISFLPVKRGS